MQAETVETAKTRGMESEVTMTTEPEASVATPAPTPTPTPSEDTEEEEEEEEERQCYICWEAETADDPIHRDCGCSGSAGMAHVQCLIEAARTRGGDSLLDPILRPWAKCNQCQMSYTGHTRDALLKAMAQDRNKTWKKRLLSSLGTSAFTLVFCVLYFAFVCSIDKILVHTAVKMEIWWETAWPAWQLSWEESREEVQILLIALAIGMVALMTAALWNDVKEMFVRYMGKLAMLAVMLDVAIIREQPENYGTSALLGHTAACVAILGAVAYRNRFALRDEMIQVRREGVLPAILGLAFGMFLLALHVYIDGFIGEVLPDKIKSIDQAASDFLARLFAFVGWGGKPDLTLDLFLDQAREQFWYCCA